MNQSSSVKTILSIIGFIVVFSFLMRLLGGLLFVALKFILPIALIVWGIRAIRGDNQNQYKRYR